MSQSLTCDNCGKSRIVGHGTVADLSWLVVGFRSMYAEDACSFACAHALVDALAEAEAEGPKPEPDADG